VWQFALAGIGYWAYREIDAETGAAIATRTRAPAISPSSQYHFLKQDGTVLVGRDLCFFAPSTQVAFALNLDTHQTRKLEITFPFDLTSSASVAHLGGSKVLMSIRQTTAGVAKDVLFLVDIAAQTCEPFQHAGAMPPSTINHNGDFGRFGFYPKRSIVFWTTRSDTEVRVMRLGG
jgi:hypothetical protein